MLTLNPRDNRRRLPMLLGRTNECARIDQLLDAARAGHGGSLVLCGEPGIGKTALLCYARESAAGMRVLTAYGVESESELPFAGLAALLHPLRAYLPELSEPQRSALEAALAVRRGEAQDRFAIGAATLALLALAGDRTPVLGIVDDAHWLDAPSADALSFAARRLDHDAVVLLFALREGEPAELKISGIPTVTLTGLSEPDCQTLLKRRHRGPLTLAAANRLARATGGNPLALLELSSVLDSDSLTAADQPAEPLPVGPEIKRAFSRRIAALPPQSQRALGLAAVSETGAMTEIAGVLRRFDLDTSALAEAEVAGLVTIILGQLRFRHPLLRAVAYGALAGPDRRVAHLAIAEMLAGAASRTRRAWHLAAAVVQPDEETARTLESAADEARARAAPVAAGAALETAARLSPAREDSIRRFLAAAGEFHLAGRRDRAIRAIDDALARDPSPLTRADLRHLRARVDFLDAPCRQMRELLSGESDRVEPLDPVRAGTMRIEAAMASVMAGDPRNGLVLARAAHPVIRPLEPPLGLAASYTLALTLLCCGEARAAEPLLAEAAPLAETDDLLTSGYLAVSVAQMHTWHDEHERAAELLRRLVARARRESALTVLPYALAALAEAEFHCGEWNSAYTAGTESVQLAEEISQRTELAHSLARLAHVEAGHGRAEACREHAGRALELAERLEVGSVVILTCASLGLLELAFGRCEAAIAHLEPAGRQAIESGTREPGISMWAADLAEAYARADRRGQAESTLQVLDEQAQTTGRCSALAAVARVRGLMTPGDTYMEHFEEALRWHERAPRPFELARTQLCLGERLRRAKRPADARAPLRAALAIFEGLGASPWVDRARLELRASGDGGRPRTFAGDELTPQERQVATLVVDGATNRETASALFMSPKTVEVHLTRIYRKLGVRSRTELARELNQRSASRRNGLFQRDHAVEDADRPEVAGERETP